MRGRVNAIRTFKGLVADLRYTKENPRGLGEAMASMDKDVYSRTNKVFGVSVNYKF